MTTRPEPDVAESDESRRTTLFARADEISPDDFPALKNVSAAFLFAGVVKPDEPARPEYVAIPMANSLALAGVVGQWNLLWEAGQFRRRFFDEDELPEPLRRIADRGDVNVSLVPRTVSRYFEYAPLMHLLPESTLQRFNLPTLRAGTWPYIADWGYDALLPADFASRLSAAWAFTVWPYLNSGSRMSAFLDHEPIRLLSHNLDYWVPAVTEVIQRVLRGFPEVDNGVTPGPVSLINGGILDGATTANPRMGGSIWVGEDEAAAKVKETIDAADSTGQLRSIIDAVRSNRVEDDFSQHWSNAREDFERKMYKKRSKVKVSFVELKDTIPVQSAESDIDGALITNDFLTVLDEKNRQIVVMLSSGMTKTDIGEALGYAGHSAVSKRLQQIQKAAAAYFGE